MITLAEYVFWKQPDVASLLLAGSEIAAGLVQVTAVAEEHGFDYWKRLMEENPKSGRGGLLKGEKAI